MSRVLGFLAAAAVLAAAAGWLLRARRIEVTPGEEGAGGPAGQAEAPPLLEERSLLAVRAARRSASEGAGGAGLPLPAAFAPDRRPEGLYAWGMVVDERGEPVPLAEVESAWMDENGNPGVRVAARTTTDESGRYLLPYPEDLPFHRRTLRARGAGRASATQEIAPCRFQRVEVHPAVRVEGRVLAQDTGYPIAGASVVEWAGPDGGWFGRHAWSSAVASGSDGRFTFEAPRAGLRVSAWQEGYGWARTSLPWDGDGGPTLDVTLHLEPAGKTTLRGRLVHDGRPVAGGLVRLLNVSFGVDRDPVASALSDRDGRFDLEFVYGRDHALEARVGHLRAFDLVHSSTEEVRDLELLPVLGVSGTVTRGGRPAPGVTVEMRRDGPRELLTARTDDLGRYRFEDVRRPRSTARFWIHLPGGGREAPWTSVVVRHEQQEDADALPVDLPSARLRGHVRDEAGRPVVRAVVGDPAYRDVTTTDEEGAYEIACPTGSARVEAAAPGYVTDWLMLASLEDGATHDFVLRRGGALEGRATCEDPDDPDDPGVTVRLVGRGETPFSRTARDGSWRLEGLCGASFRVRFEREGFESVEVGDLRPDSVVPPVVLRRSGRAAPAPQVAKEETPR